jgi:hypothetical protein
VHPIKKLKSLIWNLPDVIGWKTRRKIIVIESDDWGSIRIPSRRSWKALYSKMPHGYNSPFNRYDTLESPADLADLVEVLDSVKDCNGSPSILTANTILANPDFDKIKISQFNSYHYETFLTTYKRYGYDSIIGIWKDAIRNNVVRPQFHGREHVNVSHWLNQLLVGNQALLNAFEYEVCSTDNFDSSTKRSNLQASLDFNTQEELIFTLDSLGDGLRLFESHFGFKSESFIATAYTWDKPHEYVLNSNKVNFIQGNRNQKVPQLGKNLFRKRMHRLGERNTLNQVYLVRNVFFEPCVQGNREIVDECLYRISLSFKYHRPAIISSHRINFVRGLNDSYPKNLRQFQSLLKKIVMRWPDVEFLSSDQLGREMRHQVL